MMPPHFFVTGTAHQRVSERSIEIALQHYSDTPLRATDNVLQRAAQNDDIVVIPANQDGRSLYERYRLRYLAMKDSSSPGRTRVNLVTGVDSMPDDAWDAMLPLMEDGPTNLVWIFATANPSETRRPAAAKVLSLCERVDVPE